MSNQLNSPELKNTGEIMSVDENKLRSTAAEDPARQASEQPWVEMECYQLGAGGTLAQIEILDFGNQQLVRETQAATVLKVGATPHDFCTISYTSHSPEFRFSELSTGADDLLFFLPAQTEFDILVPAGSQTVYLGFSQAAFLRGAHALNPTEWELAPDKLRKINSAQSIVLKTAVKQWFRAAEMCVVQSSKLNPDLIRESLLQTTLQIVAGSAVQGEIPSAMERARAYYTYRKARTFIEESFALDAVPSTVEICLSIGVSERALQYAFRTYVGMSPIVFLRLCRLSRVRSTLRLANPATASVTEIAMRYGFLHLGRFASDYRRIYGESPSATLAS